MRVANEENIFFWSYEEKLDRKCPWTSIRNITTRSTTLQPATPATSVVQNIKKAQLMKRLLRPSETQERRSLLFPSIRAEASITWKLRKCAVPLARPIQFPSQVSDISLTAKPTYKLWISYEPIITVTHKARGLLDSGAGVNLIHSSTILNAWKNRIKWNKVLTLGTVTKQPLALNGLILLHFRLGDFSTQIWLQ